MNIAEIADLSQYKRIELGATPVSASITRLSLPLNGVLSMNQGGHANGQELARLPSILFTAENDSGETIQFRKSLVLEEERNELFRAFPDMEEAVNKLLEDEHARFFRETSRPDWISQMEDVALDQSVGLIDGVQTSPDSMGRSHQIVHITSPVLLTE